MNNADIIDLSLCFARHHPVVSSGPVEFCLVCHFRTDASFAVYSQQLLKRIKDAIDGKKKLD